MFYFKATHFFSILNKDKISLKCKISHLNIASFWYFHICCLLLFPHNTFFLIIKTCSFIIPLISVIQVAKNSYSQVTSDHIKIHRNIKICPKLVKQLHAVLIKAENNSLFSFYNCKPLDPRTDTEIWLSCPPIRCGYLMLSMLCFGSLFSLSPALL